MTNAITYLRDLPERNRDRVFLVDSFSGREMTFGQFHDSACRIGSELRSSGLQPGDHIAVALHNSSAFAQLYLACLYARLVVVPVNPLLGEAEAQYIIQNSGAVAVVVDSATGESVDVSAYAEAGLKLWHLSDTAIGQPLPGCSWLAVDELSDDHDFVPLNGASPEDAMCMVFTSGTTAFPKGVVHTISSMVDNARLFSRRVGIGPENRFYGVLAMTYLGGYYNLLMLPYVSEASVVICPAFDARTVARFWEPAIRFDVNTLWFVPTIMSILLELDRTDEGAKFCHDNVRLSLVGTAPLSGAQRRRFEEKYGVRLLENYGLSETFFISTNTPAHDVRDGCVGKVLPGVQVTIVDDENRELEYDTPGEICVSSPYLMNGYFDPDRREVDAVETGSWFPTGDLGSLNPNGDLFITGRKKDMIIRGGINISPASIENVIDSHADVIECAVVGVPHAISGEDVVAVLRIGTAADRDKVKQETAKACGEILGQVRVPATMLEIDEFPKTSSGKIKKDQVREYVMQKLGIEHRAPSPDPKAATTPLALHGTVVRNIERASATIVSALAEFPVSIVSDSMNRLGAMNGRMQSIVRGRTFAGTAVTVDEVEGGNLMSHAALELIQPGDVLVIDAKACATRSCWGGLQARMAKLRGAVAVVVDGYIRDYEDVVELGIPVFAMGMHPGGPLKGWAGHINRPISCGGVVVTPGDVVLGDDDGVVVVARDKAALLIPMCTERLRLEEEWMERVEAGESTLDIVGLRKNLERLNCEFT